jgi:hypothetical protein
MNVLGIETEGERSSQSYCMCSGFDFEKNHTPCTDECWFDWIVDAALATTE